MTSSNPNSPTNSPLNFRPFAIGKRGQKFRFIPTNAIGLAKPVITQALQTGGDAIQVTWGESGGTSYALQVSTNGGTTFSDVTTTAGTSFTHTGLSFPGSYTYRVRATVDAEVSDWSDSVTETMVDVPAAPGGLTVTGATTSSISLSWNDTADEGSYSIEASVDGLGSWSGVGSTGQNVVTFTHSGLAESVQRHYRVTAFNKAGGSIPSSTANSWTVPAAPTGLTATVISSTQIDLAWTDVSTGNQSYKVERSTDNVNWTEIATGLSATATTYSATGLTASTLYYFRVRAANPARNSAYSNAASATTQAGGVPAATFDLNFTTNPYVGTRFSRGSRATFVNSSGYIQTAELNGIIQSEDFSTTWVNQGATVTVNATTAPDGSTNADRIVEDANSANHARRQDVTRGDFVYSCYLKADQRTAAGLRIWIGSNNWMACSFNLSAGTAGSIVSGSGCTITSAASGITSVGNGWYRCWIRGSNSSVSMQHNVEILSSASPTRRADNGAEDYTGNTANGIFAWGAQSEAGNTAPGMYVRTTTVAVGTPRITHDPVTLAPLGLLVEAQATNNLLRSEDWSAMWVLAGSTQTANSATSPSGVSNGTRLSEDTTVGAHETYQSIGASQNYCFSVFLKAQQRTAASTTIYRAANDWVTCTFDLSAGTAGTVAVGSASGWSNAAATIENYGNGWYRCSVRATHSSSSSSFAGISLNSSATPTRQANNGIEGYAGNTANGLLAWGAQVEFTNAPPTSYIPTTTATVTRSGDAWNILSTEMSTLWNQSQGSLVAKGRIYTPFTHGGLVRTGVANSNANSYFTSTASTGGTRPAIRVAGTSYNSGPAGSPTSGAVVNTGYSYNQATPAFTGFVGGTAGSTLTNSLSAVTIDKLEVGSRVENSMASGTSYGVASSVYIIERLRYWNTALSNADMQTATT